ncbi:MAG: DUF4097 family beta strand repeat-containing protein [Anaeroplasma sp.]
MRDDYLKELELELNLNNIKNKDEILSKYKKRYDFGLEAEMPEEKIEEMLGNPKEIVEKLKDENSSVDYDFTTSELKKGYNLIVKTISADIIIKESKDDKIHTFFESIDLDCYEVKNNTKEGVYIAFKKTKYFSLNRKTDGLITIEIPQNRFFDKIYISSTSGDIKFNQLKSASAEFFIVSGDLSFSSLSSDRIWLHTVSGDINGNTVYTKEIDLNSVSGDISINKVSSELIRIDTVSGDVKIDTSIGNLKVTSVTGDVIIDGVVNKNFKNIVKGVFK